MALDDVRELRAENERLSVSLQDVKQAKVASPVGGGFDWESQKKALLAQLESDFDDEDPDHAKDRLTVEGAIQITDQVVAEKEHLVAEREKLVADKEREIEELKQLLDQQTGNIGDVAVGAAAIAEMLDQDELIREERENLAKLQLEWRDKVRQAEVDNSVERAKLAREKAQLEEELQSIKQERARYGNAKSAASDSSQDSGKSKQSRRWLTRLGIKDD